MRRTVFGLGVLLCLVVGLGMWANRASPRVAFVGDSLTQGWKLPRVNYGIYGQTTEQMAERLPGELAGHRVLVLLGGTNDTLLGVDKAVTLGNLGRMVEMARGVGVEPVLCEIPPIYREAGRYEEAVEGLDAGIVALGAAKGVKVVDYYGALKGHPWAYSDGVHLKTRGYLRMEWALLRQVWVF